MVNSVVGGGNEIDANVKVFYMDVSHRHLLHITKPHPISFSVSHYAVTLAI
ncbi:MAG: hypothetical protein QXM02_05650 [Thermoproteota archaeon]